jgi:arylsulfatase A-like enzyme
MLSHENRLSIIFDNWKYIHYLDSDDEELYSLDEDPRELHSVAQSNSQALLRAQGLLASYMDQVASLSERLKLEEAEDPELRKDVLEDLKALGYLQ